MVTNGRLISSFSFLKEPVIQFVGSFFLSFFNNIIISSSIKYSNIEGYSLMYAGLLFILIKFFPSKENCCFNPNITIAFIITLKKKLPISLFILFMQFFGNFIGIVLAFLLLQSKLNNIDELSGQKFGEFFFPFVFNERTSRSVLLLVEAMSIFILVIASLTNERGKATYVALSQFILSYNSLIFYFNNNLGNIFMHLNTAIIAKLFAHMIDAFNILYINSCAALIGIVCGSIGFYLLQLNSFNNKSDEESIRMRTQLPKKENKIFDIEKNLNH